MVTNVSMWYLSEYNTEYDPLNNDELTNEYETTDIETNYATTVHDQVEVDTVYLEEDMHQNEQETNDDVDAHNEYENNGRIQCQYVQQYVLISSYNI